MSDELYQKTYETVSLRQTLKEIQDIFEFEIIPNIHKKVSNEIKSFYKDLSFLANHSNASVFRNNTALHEVGDYLGISFDCDEGDLKIYFYCFDEEFKTLLTSELLTVKKFLSENDLKELKRLETKEDLMTAYSNVYQRYEKSIIKYCLTATQGFDCEEKEIKKTIQSVALQTFKKQLLGFLNA